MRSAARLRPRRAFVLAVLGLYAACRLVTTTILLVVMQRQVPSGMTGGEAAPVTYFPFTALWDGQWYQIIATEGYPDHVPRGDDGGVQQNPWAFYPLFPFAARALMAVTGLGFPAAGSTIALLCGFGAAVLMAFLLRDRIGERATLVVVVLWASFPASVVLQLAYTEALAMLLLLGYLYALARERWLVAAAVAVLVGLARPIAVPLGVVTLVALWLRWRARGLRPITTREYAAGLASLVGCGVAGLLWPAIAWWGTGDRSAYTDTMGAWRGSGVVEPFVPWLGMSKYAFGDTWGPVWLVVVPTVVIAMVAGPWARALGAELRTWTVAYPAYLAAVLDPFTSIFRYLIPLFPLLVVAVGAGWTDPARERRASSWPLLLVRAVPLLVLFVVGQYYWTDILWRYVPSPTGDYPP
ncbi:hypothetical protein [Intrasporangium calvum]|uniref:Integral membrane protein n=1 Tax=Intrasporangium calvum (strain ATCC 23552 / DSM 43043 / JCM 3097 / NBRC 12989 / NCIMB 10167 / NRRL B-3866 / 7 KIP) TaxID=710696 RepID=E6S808_INTC7|nr:hypothetical protein [Intrasporangium calvum]ADU49104.1 integral membrane protein [Intrasporangium calvum DSM 43043]AXG14053.1 hypothetical protein DN585_12160 [Intrasporangium calvum]